MLRRLLLALVLVTSVVACQPTSRPVVSPAPATADIPQPASLAVKAEPDGASISVDGVAVGVSPITVTLPAGNHQIQLSAPGRAPISETITLAAGQQGIYAPILAGVGSPIVNLSVDPTNVPWLGSAQVRVEASAAVTVTEVQLLLDGQLLGDVEGDTLALDLSPSLLPGLTPGGVYTLTARAVDAGGSTGEASIALSVGILPQVTPASATVVSPTASTGRLGVTGGQPGATATRAAPGRQQTPTPVVTVVPEETAATSEESPAEQVPVSAPATVSVKTISIPTYPYAAYLSPVVDSAMGGYPLMVFDREAYEKANPQPKARSYTLIVLENTYLRLSILPELGGRIYECIFKPTGHNEFYRNPVIKPTQWGPSAPAHPAGANWWIAAGGMEWGFPVEEHGYEFATHWGYDPIEQPDGSVMVSLFTHDPSNPYAVVDVILPADAAYFILKPHISNPLDKAFRFKWWTNAMLAPGGNNTPGADLRFVFPTSEMTVHSTGDLSLPKEGNSLSWPVYNGRDLSRLGNWDGWLGFFERPAAKGSFTAVYDTGADEGMARIFPADQVKGAKGFGAGWRSPMDWHQWTDDAAGKGSGYVEMHGGLTPTFDDFYTLAPNDDISWSETWYPVAGIGNLTYASEVAALNIARAGSALKVGVFPTKVIQGKLVVSWPGSGPMTRDVDIEPGQPFNEVLAGTPPPGAEVQVVLSDATGKTLLSYKQKVP